MPRAAKLKVFRTPIGFHDAYVAAPSQKAAMEAWGSDKDLFARGEAELVTDPRLAAEPLSKPGVVVKRLRGTAAEHMAALPEAPKGGEKPAKAKPKARRAKPKPRPSRAKVDAAEEALTEAERRHADKLKALAEREAKLRRERRELEKTQAQELAKLAGERDKARDQYETAMQRWRG